MAESSTKKCSAGIEAHCLTRCGIGRKKELKISNIYDLNENEVAAMLLENSKMTPTWENVIDYYENIEEKVDESTIVFLNNVENFIL